MTNNELCLEKHENEKKELEKVLLKSKDVSYLAEFFKVFSDPTRLQIINLLAHEEICVCDITKLMGMQQSAISHQLKILRNHRLVKTRKVKKQVFYSLDDEHIMLIYKMGLEHVNE